MSKLFRYQTLLSSGLLLALSVVVVLVLPFADKGAKAKFSSGATAKDSSLNLTDWQYQREIKIPALIGDTYVELPLDEQVVKNSRQDLADLRVVDDNGTSVPYKLLSSADTIVKKSFSVNNRNSTHVPNGFVSVTLDLGEKQIFHNRVYVQTEAKDFQRSVMLQTSKDGLNWETVLEQGKIYDFKIPEFPDRVHGTSLKYPFSTERFLRVRVSDKNKQPLSIKGLVLTYFPREPVSTTEYQNTYQKLNLDQDDTRTIYSIQLPAESLPHNYLEIKTPAVNFQRKVKLFGSKDGQDWKPLLESSIYNHQLLDFRVAKRRLQYSSTEYPFLRLQIENGQKEPLLVQGFKIGGNVGALTFRSDPRRDYKLYYGNPKADFPRFNLAEKFKYLTYLENPQAVLGDSGQKDMGYQTDNSLLIGKNPPLGLNPEQKRLVVALSFTILALFLLKLVFPYPQQKS